MYEITSIMITYTGNFLANNGKLHVAQFNAYQQEVDLAYNDVLQVVPGRGDSGTRAWLGGGGLDVIHVI